jgi:hypothetical protein
MLGLRQRRIRLRRKSPKFLQVLGPPLKRGVIDDFFQHFTFSEISKE